MLSTHMYRFLTFKRPVRMDHGPRAPQLPHSNAARMFAMLHPLPRLGSHSNPPYDVSYVPYAHIVVHDRNLIDISLLDLSHLTIFILRPSPSSTLPTREE